MKKPSFAQLCLHDGPEYQFSQSHTLPIIASSTFVYESAGKSQAVFRGEAESYIYSRWENPTVKAVEQKLARLECFDLEESAECLLFSSGMAAIHAVLIANTKAGDRILTHSNIYGTTVELMQAVLPEHGVETDFTSFESEESIISAIKPETKVLYIESPNNPGIQCLDLNMIARIAKEYNLITIIDATFASPFLLRPLTFGIDFVLHSATKYLNGHGSGLAGCVTSLNKEFIRKKLWTVRKTMGAILSPFEAYLLNLGIKTLPIRMVQHSNTAYELAKWMESRPEFTKVHYPGLKSHASHEIANSQMHDFGGMLAFELDANQDACVAFLDACKGLTLTASLGTPDTLLQHPATMTHVKVPREQRIAGGITDNMFRLSVGLENPEDLISIFENALTQIQITK